MKTPTAAPPAEAAQCRILEGVPPRSVIRGLAACDGLVVLSGAWAGGGVVIAQEPVRTASDIADVGGVPLSEQTSLSNMDGVGGGWFGWLGYPQGGAARSGWFGLYPNVVRYGRRERAWFDEALTGVVADDELARRRVKAVGTVREASVTPPAPAPYRLGPLHAGVTAGEYTAMVEQCVERIRAGEVYQANICFRLSGEFGGDAAALFADLLDALEPDYAALICGPDFTVVSMSPELFLCRKGRAVTSAPIKGTRARQPGVDPDPQADELRRSEKERAENVMIVDLVRNDLAQVADIGSVAVPSLLRVEPHCGVWHLVSRVSATLPPGTGDSALLDAAFPPGSVTGAPKLSARLVIDDLEAAPRGVYTGAVGYLSPISGLELNVAIRTVEISGSGQRRRAELGVGAGITAGSTPVLEWWECLDKAAPLAGAVNAAVVAPGPSRTAHAGLEQAGVFETMLVLDGRVIDLDAHLARLRDSVSELWDARLPASAGAQLTDQAARLPSPAARLRVDIVREADGNVRVTSRSGRTMRPAPSVCQSGERLRVATLADGIGRHKWADRSVLDALEARHRGQQVLVVDGDGLSLETTRGNLLIFNGRKVATPPLDGRILPGITRRTVLDLARTIGLGVDVRPVPLGELVAADGVAVCGSLSGLVWVRWCPAGSWTAPAPALAELSDALLARWEKR